MYLLRQTYYNFGEIMKKNTYGLIVIATIAVVAIGGILIYTIGKNNNTGINSSSSVQADTSSATYQQYAALKGEAYDKMFLSNMIIHHQGAVDMAKLALVNAQRQELKDMANDIISAQTKEISNMQSWQTDWGYPVTSSAIVTNRASTGMMNDMAAMTDTLKGLSGDAFDEAFLSSMISHHQSAINMAAMGKTNAQHQEVKDLTVAIVNAQTKEVEQMQQWQMDWGFKDSSSSMPGMNH